MSDNRNNKQDGQANPMHQAITELLDGARRIVQRIWYPVLLVGLIVFLLEIQRSEYLIYKQFNGANLYTETIGLIGNLYKIIINNLRW